MRIVQLLDADPELAQGLPEKELSLAARALPAPVINLPEGPWDAPSTRHDHGDIGLLVAGGLLVRRLRVARGSSVELLGHGELLRPWQEDTSSFCASSWEVLEETTLLLLTARIAEGLVRWPILVSNLFGRAIRRSRALAADTAVSSIIGVEDRLLLLLWQLAETWGRTGAEGIVLEISVPHRILAEMLGARRPSVTAAMGRLEEGGHLTRTTDGSWVLRGDPPC